MGSPEYRYKGASKSLKRYVLERDGANAKDYEVHHILPVYYAVAMLGLSYEEVNHPHNLVAIPKDLHRPTHGIHLLPHEVKSKISSGEKYWNTQHDEELARQARENTQRFESQGHVYKKRERSQKINVYSAI